MNRSRRIATGMLAIAVAVLAGSATPSCGSSLFDGLTGGALDAGPAPANGRNCASAVPPPRPEGPDGPSTEKRLFAFEQVRFSAAESEDASLPAPRGLDLDRACTCPEPPSCVRKRGPSLDGGPCDGENGRDNAVGGLFDILETAQQQTASISATGRVRDGLSNLLVELTDWNGLPDDPHVRVSFYVSEQLDRASLDAGPLDPPRFDGTDIWTVAPTSIVAGDLYLGRDCRDPSVVCVPTIVDADAYVRGGTLVAAVRTSDSEGPRIGTDFGGLFIELVDAVLVAKLEDTGAGDVRLVGELAGRATAERFLAAVANLEAPFQRDAGLCANQEVYAQIKDLVCGAVDLAERHDLDGIEADCSALSAALSFRAGTAQIGRVFRRTRPPARCGELADDCAR